MALARHFVQTYPKVWSAAAGVGARVAWHQQVARVQVSKAKIKVEATPWTRVSTFGSAHNHGLTPHSCSLFRFNGPLRRENHVARLCCGGHRAAHMLCGGLRGRQGGRVWRCGPASCWQHRMKAY